jgi:hypothetical protein
MDHIHTWREVHEQGILGGSLRVGWECRLCDAFVTVNDITPAGLSGVDTGDVRLYGIHGGRVRNADGVSSSKEQILHKDGSLTHVDRLTDKEWYERNG